MLAARKWRSSLGGLVLAACLTAPLSSGREDVAPQEGVVERPAGAQEMFPHIRVDREARTIEIEARVPIRLDDPDAPHVYIELIACTPDTREHEVLVVTAAKPSHVHAALLLLGLEPGSPATWEREGEQIKPIAPSGPRVEVALIHENAQGAKVMSHPSDWIVNAKTGEHLERRDWVFAGSRILNQPGIEPYDADGAGTLIGLCSFGSEVLSWPVVVSADSWVDEPVWIADVANVPPLDTPVIIRLHAPVFEGEPGGEKDLSPDQREKK